MKLVTQRSLDKTIGVLLCRFLSLFPWRYRRVPPGFQPRRILVILLSEMGTLVLAKSMFDLLSTKYPGADIHLLVFEKNKDVLEVLGLVRKKNVLTIEDRSFPWFFFTGLRALSKLRRMGFDTVIDCELFSRISSLLSVMSGAKVRVGFEPHTQEGLFRGRFINRPVLYNPYMHISLQLTYMVESLSAGGMPLVKKELVKASPSFDPSLWDIEEQKIRFFARIERDFPILKTIDLVLVYPGGGLLPIRAWPISHYCELARGLIHRKCAVGIIGTTEDKKLARELLRECGEEKCLDFTGYTRNIKELLFLFQRSILLIGNDGGPAHFASVSSTPTIVFYGPETPFLYGPLGEACVFYTHLSCSPCLTAYNHRNSPCDGDNQCLKRISPRSVLDKVDKMIESKERVNTSASPIFNPLLSEEGI